MRKYAIADIGSNTVKMSIFAQDGSLLHKEIVPLGLIGYVKERVLSEKGIHALQNTLLRFSSLAEKEGAGPLYAFATASLRAADNAAEVIETIRTQIGCTIDLVSGEEEAALSLAGMGLVAGVGDACGTLLDMGGGSSEVLSFDKSALTHKPISLPFGALVLFNRFVKNILPDEKETAAVRDYVTALARENGIEKRDGSLLAVGGTVRALGALHAEHFEKAYQTPYTMTKDELNTLLACMIQGDNETKLAMLRLFPTRVHTVPTGLIAHLALMDTLNSDAITVVDGGAREGYFLKIRKNDEENRHEA